MKKKTLEEVITQANIMHNFKYDYSKAKYDGTKSKVVIICPKHGEWEVTWDNHVTQKNGCSKCSGTYKPTLKEIIQKANIVHKFKYDYSKAEYVNNKNKTTVICPKHGEWQVSWKNHLNKKTGCPICGSEINASKRTGTLEEAISRANIIHDNKYDYSEAIYINSHTKTVVVCPEHGKWIVKWNNHLNNKTGCPVCAEISKQSRYLDKPTLFYYLKYKGLYKLGITTKTIKERYASEIDKTQWEDVEILYNTEFCTGSKAFLLEQTLLSKYRDFVYEGTPIFKVTGNSEVFKEDILGFEEYNIERQEYFEDILKVTEMSKEEYLEIKR